MFGLPSFSKRPPDSWRLTLGFSHQQELEVAWTAADGEAAVLAAVQAVLASPELVHEHVRVQLAPARQQLLGVVAAAGFGQAAARLSLAVEASRSRLVSAELSRTSGTTAMSTSVALALWSALDVAAVTRLRAADAGAVAALADARVLRSFAALRVLNLSHAGLGALPAAIALLPELQELRVVGNQLRILPPDIGQLTNLRVLAADSNQLTILPGELRRCELLEELTLQHNRLTSVLLSFASLRSLSVLHLYDNPLEYLPEISPCTRLTHLTVANLRVTADPGFSRFKVEVLPPPPGASGSGLAIPLWDSKPSDKLRPIFALMLRRSSGHHPLLAGALRTLAEEDPKNRELMAKQENGLQQLVLMALSDSPVVVAETCRTLTLLAEHSPALAEAVVENDAAAVMRLLAAGDAARQLSTLRLLAAIAASSPAASARLASDDLLLALEELAVGPWQDSAPEVPQEAASSTAAAAAAELGLGAAAAAASPRQAVRTAALKALGNLAFCSDNQRRLERNTGLMRRLSQLALDRDAPAKLQAAALRVLAILGENDLVRRAVGKPPVQGRGLRILSLDGGGMKGMATVRLLRELERHAGRRIPDMFDLIVGTSTGGLLAVALGLRRMSVEQCTFIYKVLGQRVFSKVVPTAKGDAKEGWVEAFYRTFQSKTSHVRAVVVGYKHDAAVYEALLREYCDFSRQERCIGDAMIDTACLPVPHVALVSTLASVSPAPPFVFRNYQLPPGSAPLAAAISAHAGSCKHPVWQAVRASSAASFYLEDFSCGGDKFQDGAVTANNPVVVALQEARLLAPDLPLGTVISLGVGVAPPARRDKGLTTFMETGAILIESSTSVTRADEAVSTLLPLVPGVKYFRFCAEDPRCAMELDEIDPQRWAALEAATDDYIAQPATQAKFAEAAAALGSAPSAEAAAAAPPAAASGALRLGSRRQLVVLRAPRLAGQLSGVHDGVAASLAGLPGCAAALNLQRLELSEAPDRLERQAGLQPAAAQPPAAVAAVAAVAAAAAPTGGGRAAGQAAAVGAAAQADALAGGEAAGGGGAADEGGGFSAYLSSWFGSPAKPQPPASPPAAAAAAGATASPPAGNRVQGGGAGRGDPSSSPGSNPLRMAEQPARAAAPHAAPVWCGTASGEAQHRLLSELERRLAAALPSVGVLHLGAEALEEEGLVLRWRQRLQAVADPSEEASALLHALGPHPAGTRLSDVFARRPSVALAGGRTLSALSSQTQWTDGGPLSTLLLSSCSPEVVLRPDGLAPLAWLIRGQLVVCTAVLPRGFSAALLAAGARLVVCRAEEAGDAQEDVAAEPGLQDSCGFFAAFYEALFAGRSVAGALAAAEEAAPALEGLYHLQGAA